MSELKSGQPLSAEDVKLLVKGDLLRLDKPAGPSNAQGDLFTFTQPTPLRDLAVDVQKVGENASVSWHISRLSFIGRPDADGWVPRSGGENPVPGQWVQVRQRGYQLDDESRWFADQQRWTDTGHAGDIIALIRPAPVASGGQHSSGEADRKAAEWPSCVACEDKPSPGNNPCAVCGLTTPAQDDDKLRIAVEALERIAHEARPVTRSVMREYAAEALAALKAEGK